MVRCHNDVDVGEVIEDVYNRLRDNLKIRVRVVVKYWKAGSDDASRELVGAVVAGRGLSGACLATTSAGVELDLFRPLELVSCQELSCDNYPIP